MQSPAAIEITNRFRKAVEYARRLEGWGMVKRFCERRGINETQFYSTLGHPELRILQPYWIAALCGDYNLSAEWIMTGAGKMIKESRGQKHTKSIQ